MEIREISITASASSNYQKGECTITGSVVSDEEINQLRAMAIHQAKCTLYELNTEPNYDCSLNTTNSYQQQTMQQQVPQERPATQAQLNYANRLGANLNLDEFHSFKEVSGIIDALKKIELFMD